MSLLTAEEHGCAGAGTAMLLTAEEQGQSVAALADLTRSIIPPKLWEEPWEYCCGVNDFKLPSPYPDLDGRDFPWAPRVSQNHGRTVPELFTGTYQPCGADTHVRLHGLQRYPNGDKFDGDFMNYNGTPSEGTYTFANGNTLKGHFSGVSNAEVHPNTITMGTFYNKSNGMSYTGQWTTSPTGESNLSGYILIEQDTDAASAWGKGISDVIYYRDGKYYESFNKWLIVQTDGEGSGDPSYDPMPFPVDDTLHPAAPEALWLAEFKKRIVTVRAVCGGGGAAGD